MKKLIPSYILSLVFSFMLYIYEPLNMYLSNKDDFWFDIPTIILPIIIAFLCLSIFFSLLFTGIYFISKKFNKEKIYNISLLVFFIIFIITYINGNYLIGNLPALDGGKINWNKYNLENIISIIVIVSVSLICIVSVIKFKIENVINKISFISIAILIMLCSSLVASIKPHSFDKKILSTTTMMNYNVESTDKNFYVLVLDSVDSVMFEKVMTNNKEYKEVFKDFTYFKDTTSTYLYTRDSIPYILSGIWNENKTDFSTYYNKAMDDSMLIKELKERKYNINLYENEFNWKTNKRNIVSNLTELNRNIDSISYIKQQTKYVLFKYLPYPLKRFSKIETMDYEIIKRKKDIELYGWGNKFNYDHFNEDEIKLTKDKMFKFIHIEGSHLPFDMDENFNPVNDGTYEQKLGSSLNIIKAFLNKLRENDVYDNSAIIILSDHGYEMNLESIGRQNPILFVKGIDEHHDMKNSDIKVSYTDLNALYLDLLDDKKSTEVFSDIPEDRERRIMVYEYLKENKMEEYIQKGNAWDNETMVKTGKKYNRK